MNLQTTYEFTLPKGYIDSEGNLHKNGVMRLATAADEIFPLRDARVKENPDYLTVLLLARVVQNLGDISPVTPDMIEKLFTADLNFLQNIYRTINEAETPTISVTCPHCGQSFTDTLNFTRLA